MEEIIKLQDEIEKLSDNLYDFIERPNKSKSKNLRLELGEVKKKITDYRKILMDLDKAGY